MLNILILENNPIICKNLINKIQSSELSAKVFNIAYSESEALEILKNNIIDITILNINNCSINFIKFIKKYFVNMSVIAFTLDSKNFKNDLKYKHLFYELIQNEPIEQNVFNSLIKLIRLKADSKKHLLSNIYDELEKIHFDLGYKGTQYLCECILLIYPFNCDRININNVVYTKVSQKYNSNINNIKCGIYQATYRCYQYYHSDLETYFNRKIVKKPTTKEIINEIIKHIIQKKQSANVS
ncbi:MAG: hypothetical protein IJW20_07400 [Clostridia bacterium]|nr:hypothetical protein [Clostridia bacterium]